MSLLDKIPAAAGPAGRPRRRPDALPADRGYDHGIYRRLLWQRGIRPVIARRSEPHGTGLGTFRYAVERTIAWLHGSMASAAYASAGSVATTSTKPSSASPSA